MSVDQYVFDFTASDVVAQVRAIAEERPGFVYRTLGVGAPCSYVTGQHDQGCIVGQALMRLGVPEELLAEWERRHSDVAAPDLLFDLIDAAPDDPMVKWVGKVQYDQDGAIPWGDAVLAADEEASE